jgi:hypothetical protein
MLLFASLSFPISATAAELCHTNREALVAPSVIGLKEAFSIIGSGDMKAYNQLVEQKRVMRLPADLPVFVEESFKVYRRIRPQGMADSVWTAVIYLNCPKGQGTRRR